MGTAVLKLEKTGYPITHVGNEGDGDNAYGFLWSSPPVVRVDPVVKERIPGSL